MGTRSLNGFALKRALAALMLLAALVRAAVPAGYMLAPSADGSSLIEITLCTGFGEAAAVMDLATGEVFSPDEAPGHGAETPDDAQDDLSACAFAMTAAPATQTSPVAAFAPPSEESAVFGGAVQLAPGRGLAAPPPARAPPLSA